MYSVEYPTRAMRAMVEFPFVEVTLPSFVAVFGSFSVGVSLLLLLSQEYDC
jgi:hypothetical protein